MAILLVLFFHLLWSNVETGNPWLNLAVEFRAAGWVGVDLFFSLSGFLITGILYDAINDRHYFKNFYARRVLRIFPLYYGVILVLTLCFHSSLATAGKPLLLLVGYLQNTALWWHNTPKTYLIPLSEHLWSLAVEEQFYLVWPLIVFAVKDRRRLLWVSAILSLAALGSRILLLHHGAPFVATYKLAFCRADSLLGGAWLALMIRGPSREKVLRFAPASFLASFLLCLLIAWRAHGFDWEKGWAINEYGYSVLAVASASFIAMALRPASITARLMRTSWLRFLGKYSYGIYIYHQIISGLISLAVEPILQRHLHSKTLFHLTFFVIVAGSTVLVAFLSFNLYERPFLRLKRFFNYDAPKKSIREHQLQ